MYRNTTWEPGFSGYGVQIQQVSRPNTANANAPADASTAVQLTLMPHLTLLLQLMLLSS